MPDSITPTQVDSGAHAPLIFQKMPLILAEIGAIEKKGRNVKQNFNFRGIDQCYAALYPLLAAHKVFMTATVLATSREERNSNSGGVLAFTCIHMRYSFHAEDGSSVETEAYGEGMDSGDKSSNKAMAVAHKYAILQAFCIPTEETDDPDKESHEVAPREPEVSHAQWATEAGAWINQQTDTQKIHKAWSANLDRFLTLPEKLQANLTKIRDAKLAALTAKPDGEPEPEVDAREAWTNKAIAWIGEQTSLTAVQKFWKSKAADIKALAPDQLAALERAKDNAKRRITAISAPKTQSGGTAPIDLDDEINF